MQMPFTPFATTGTTTPEIEVVEPSRPLSELISGAFDLDPDGWPIRILEAGAEPVLQILLVLGVTWLVLRLARRLSRRMLARTSRRTAERNTRGGFSSPSRRRRRLDALTTVLDSVLGGVLWTVAFLTILGTTFGISLAPLIAGAGFLGVAVGFGAQDLVKDFLSGLFMLVEDQYGVGDIVDVGEASGVVESVSLRTTRLRDLAGTSWHVPNGEIRRVGNMSQGWSRALLDIEVSYGTDTDRASAVILRVARSMADDEQHAGDFIDAPEIWGVETLGASGVAIRLAAKVEPGRQWDISRELRRRIKAAFDDEGIEIPFPQQSVWLRESATERDELVSA